MTSLCTVHDLENVHVNVQQRQKDTLSLQANASLAGCATATKHTLLQCVAQVCMNALRPRQGSMWPCSTLETSAQVSNKVVQTRADLHEAQQACTVESLGQVFTNDIWVILVNLGQEHQGWDLCTASCRKPFTRFN